MATYIIKHAGKEVEFESDNIPTQSEVDQLRSYLSEQKPDDNISSIARTSANIGSNIVGAGIGGTIGSLLGPEGTPVGAIGGALIGGGIGNVVNEQLQNPRLSRVASDFGEGVKNEVLGQAVGGLLKYGTKVLGDKLPWVVSKLTGVDEKSIIESINAGEKGGEYNEKFMSAVRGKTTKSDILEGQFKNTQIDQAKEKIFDSSVKAFSKVTGKSIDELKSSGIAIPKSNGLLDMNMKPSHTSSTTDFATTLKTASQPKVDLTPLVEGNKALDKTGNGMLSGGNEISVGTLGSLMSGNPIPLAGAVGIKGAKMVANDPRVIAETANMFGRGRGLLNSAEHLSDNAKKALIRASIMGWRKNEN